MGNNSTRIFKLHTWFEQLPTEIILEIFDYLSCNDIIYTFFYLNERLNKLILQHQCYLSLELPISNSIFWKNILSDIGSKIQSLKIIKYDSSISLKLFPNLKSIIISSSYNLAEEQLESILKSDQFKKLHSLKIKSNELFFTPSFYNYSINQDLLLQKVFNNENSMNIFQYSSCIQSLSLKPINNLKLNLNLHSLILNLTQFMDLFSLIEYTPNLKYLNIKSIPPYAYHGQNQWLNNKIKLEQFYLTFNDIMYGTNRFSARRIDFHQLINVITQFSSSLFCLSLNLIGCYITSSNDLPFNGIQLQQQFLELMIKLKQFHLYAVVTQDKIDLKRILSTFQNKFWFDHNWIIGMHDKYLYTLPFHFDKLYNFIDFDHIYSNNSEILINNPKIWFNIKYIKFKKFNLDLLKLIKIYMPKLLVISIDYFNDSENIENFHIIQHKTDTILNRITTIHLTCGSLENEKQWLINSLPNLKNLILIHTELPLLKSELTLKLNEKIERLVLDGNLIVEQFEKQNYICFSNLQDLQLKFDWRFSTQIYDWYADAIIKFLKYFKNLKTLTISFNPFIAELTRSTPELELKKILVKLDKNEIAKTYEMKYLREYVIFFK
ncbi:unnamed protein product [Rotaria sordida]|uniref:F-box domain-containing protein n=1 Tax=Rotaria sordida TaxID=392033 RepID=A0A814NN16_9BILA|nr:unnamed protein product [Rotaria sordida]